MRFTTQVSVHDFPEDETRFVDVAASGDQCVIEHVSGGPVAVYDAADGSGSEMHGRAFPSWWPTPPAPVATLENNQSHPVTSRVWVGLPTDAGGIDRSYAQLRVRRTRPAN